MFRRGGARSGLDLKCQSAETRGKATSATATKGKSTPRYFMVLADDVRYPC